jgi:hypothetical protein
MVCPECSTELPDTVKFCPECGSKIAALSSPAIERAARITAFDFSRDIERLTKDFTGRDWFFQEVDRWLAAKQPRFMLLTANPGVGKSAIAAKLTQVRRDNILAYHFCTARTIGTTEPNSIFRSLSAQLLETLPDYGEALAESVEASRTEFNVNIKVDRMLGGKVVGVNIENLATSNPQELLNLLFRLPLQQLPPPSQPVCILIDSLDEAITYSDRGNLPELLSKVGNLPEWVRFLCTSRPERRVLRYFDELEPYLLDAESEENLDDIWQFAIYRVIHFQLAQSLQTLLINHVLQQSKGNYLYTKVLLDDVEAGRQPLDDLSKLPQSLDDIYHQFLTCFTFDEWRNHYSPLFSVLAVARQPLTQKHLSQFTGIRATLLNQDLGVVEQFLTKERDEQEGTAYTLFHQSFRDYLLDGSRNQDFWCVPQDCHKLITNYYIEDRYHVRWTEAPDDGYLFNHLAAHLAASEHFDELYYLISQNWMKAKFAVFHSHYPFTADVNLALTIAQLASPPNIVQQIRCCFTVATIGSLVANVQPEALVLLVRCGEMGLALEYAGQIQNLEKKYKAYLQIANTIVDSGTTESTKENVSAILDLAMNTAALIELEMKVQAYIEIAKVLLRIGDSTGLIRAFEISLNQEVEYKKGNALLEIFPLLIQSDCHNEVLKSIESALGFRDAWTKSKTTRKMAEELLKLEGTHGNYNPLASTLVSNSLGATLSNEREHIKASELGELFKILLQVENWEGFSQAMDELRAINDQSSKYYQIGPLLDALVLLKDRKGLQNVFDWVRTFRDSREKENSLLNVFKAFNQIDDREAMLEVLDAVLGTANLYNKSMALGEMAHILAQREDIWGLDKIRQEAESWDDGDYKVHVLIEVAEAMTAAKIAKASQIATLALEAATSKTAGSWDSISFKKLFAMASREAGDEDWMSKVEAAVEQIDEKYRKGDLFAQLAEAYAEADNPKKALFFANYMLDNQLDSEFIGSALPKVALALSKHEGYDALDDFLRQLANNAWLGDWILGNVAEELSKENDEATLMKALQIAQSLPKVVRTSELLNKLVYLLAEAGRKATAIRAARQSFSIMLDIFAERNTNDYEAERKVKTLSDSALALLHLGEKGYLVLGKNSVENFDHGQRKEQALMGISFAMAGAGMKDEAITSTILSIAASEKINDGRKVSSVMRNVAHLLSELGRHEEAEQVAQLFPVLDDPYSWMNPTSTNSDEIRAAVEVGDVDKLILIYDEVIRHKYLGLLDDIAIALAQFEHQEKRLEEILAVVQNHEMWQKELILPDIAEALIVAGMRDMARKVIHDSLSRSFRILIEEDDKAQVFIKSVNLLVLLGDQEKLMEVESLSGLLTEWKSKSGLERLQYFLFCAQMLGELSRALWSVKMVSESHKVLGLALKTAQVLLKKPSSKALAFGQLALVMVQVGMLAEASETINAGLKIVREELEDDLQKSLALCELAGALAALEEPYDLEQAWKMVDDIHNQAHKLTALNGFVKAFTEIESSKALEVALEAFRTSRLVGREAFFETLQTGSIALSRIDKGETLWHIFQAMMAVEDWWGDEYR